MCKCYLSNFSQCQKYCLHIYPHQTTFDVFVCTKLLSLPNIIPYYCFDKHHKYSTIILLLLHNMLKYYYHDTMCSNTTIITRYAQILLLSLHSAANPLRSTWAHAAAHVVGNHMSGYGILGSGFLHSTCASEEIQSPIYVYK